MAERDADLDDEPLIEADDLEDDDDLPLEEENPDERLGEDDPPIKPEPPARQPGRREREVIKARVRAQTAEREAQELRERLARVEGQTEILARTPARPAEDERAEAERMAAMTDSERFDYKLEKEKRLIASAFQQTAFQSNDRADKTDFRILCQENPAYDSVRQEVEDELTKMRRNGFTANREDVADKILGKRAAAKAARTAAKGQAPRARARAPAGRSDVTGDTRERKKAPATARERLEAQEAKGINPFNTRR